MIENNIKVYVMRTAMLLAVSLSILALVFAYGEMKSWNHPASQGATITVSGVAEISAIPDIATISFTVREVSKTVPEAQKLVEAKLKPALDAMTKLGILAKDVKTLSYTVNPKYEYGTNTYCPIGSYCQPKQTLVGYEVSQTTQVKVRKIESAGAAIAAVGDNKISELSGPSFDVDDIEKVKVTAKANAIKDARTKADATAEALGVSIGRIVGFSEDNGGYNPSPMLMKAESFGAVGRDTLQSVSIPAGESVIKSNVSITYELE